ncbi:MAG TPA: T9SS type A sorting domain-containing protein, partial [Bacteroidia bacterium]|nr:T9SS type A sorting domain-containing protein [Bacteroidia bacterium]
GTGPYTYSWTTLPIQTTQTATGLTHGGYTVTVTDKNACTQATKAIVTESTPLAVTTATTQETCGKRNGTATATVTTGTGPYTYSWNTSPVQTTATASGLAAGNYTVTVTDNGGCSQVLPVTITATAALNVTSTLTQENCGKKDGTATANVTGGTGSYTYSWTTLPIQTAATATGLTAGGYTVTVADQNGCTQALPVVITGSSALNVTSTLTQENCGKKDGTATANVTGGTGPYTYSWTTLPIQTTATATGLTAGGYTVTVTDKSGCSKALPIVITGSSALNVTSTLTTENCSKKDGTATANVTGGTSPYTYSWTTLPIQTAATATGLTHGGYTVTVTDKSGCSKALPVVITETAPLVVTTTLTTEDCGKKNGTATANVTGGTSPYTYSWTTLPIQTTATATGLTHGGYTVTVTDKNGCSIATPVVIKTTTTPAAAVTSTDANCLGQGGSAVVNVTDGEAPYTYEWNTVPSRSTAQVTDLGAGEYEVTIRDARGCYSKARAVVAKAEPTFTLTTVKTDVSCPSCKDGSASVIVSGQSSTYNYKWTSTGTSFMASGNSATGMSVGNYSITVTDLKGCSKQSTTTISSSMTTGIEAEGAASEDITIFPNPAQNKFNISNDSFKPHESVLVVLYNTAGVEVYSKIVVKEDEVIAVDTENRLDPGIYIVVASSQDHLYKKKIIITQ